MAGESGRALRLPLAARTRLRLAATHGVRVSADVVRTMYDLAGGSAIYDDAPLQRRFRDAFTATAHFQVNEASRELPGRILLGPGHRGGDAVRAPIEAVLPFWLDTPDEEAFEIADRGQRGRAERAVDRRDGDVRRLRVGHRRRPARTGVGFEGRTAADRRAQPGVDCVGREFGCVAHRRQIDVALGASSPFIVAGWHDREWSHSAARMRETIECLRPIVRGERADYDGRYVRSQGFRLRHPLPPTRIGVGAFGPMMTQLAAELSRRGGAQSGIAAAGFAGARASRAPCRRGRLARRRT